MVKAKPEAVAKLLPYVNLDAKPRGPKEPIVLKNRDDKSLKDYFDTPYTIGSRRQVNRLNASYYKPDLVERATSAGGRWSSGSDPLPYYFAGRQVNDHAAHLVRFSAEWDTFIKGAPGPGGLRDNEAITGLRKDSPWLSRRSWPSCMTSLPRS